VKAGKVEKAAEQDWAQPAPSAKTEVDPWLNLDSLLDAVFAEPLLEPEPEPLAEPTRDEKEGEL
jgi:hypothetical protein